MVIKLVCEKCGQGYNVESSLAGRKVRCRHCQHVMAVPVAAPAAVEARRELSLAPSDTDIVPVMDPPPSGGEQSEFVPLAPPSGRAMTPVLRPELLEAGPSQPRRSVDSSAPAIGVVQVFYANMGKLFLLALAVAIGLGVYFGKDKVQGKAAQLWQQVTARGGNASSPASPPAAKTKDGQRREPESAPPAPQAAATPPQVAQSPAPSPDRVMAPRPFADAAVTPPPAPIGAVLVTPPPADPTPPPAPAPAPPALTEEQQAIAQLRQLGGLVAMRGDSVEGIDISQAPDLDKVLETLPKLGKVSVVRISAACLTPQRVVMLKQAPGLRRVEADSAAITDAQLKAMGELTDLEELTLSANPITDAGLAHLKAMAGLKRLYLKETKITSTGLAHLEGMVALNILDLSQTCVADDGLVHLKELKNLIVLLVRNTEVTREGVADLKKSLPKANIVGP